MTSTSRRPSGRPTRQNAEAMTERILDGARSVFSCKGVANASMEEIAAELGISKHTLYRRHPTKQILLEAVVERDLVRFRQVLEEAAAQCADPLEALRHAALRYFLFGADREYSAFYLSVIAEAALSRPLREKLAEWSNAALAPLVNAVVAAQSAGVVVPGNAEEICGILVDLLEGANNRVRLSLADHLEEAECLQHFKRRWAVFQAAMAPRTQQT